MGKMKERQKGRRKQDQTSTDRGKRGVGGGARGVIRRTKHHTPREQIIECIPYYITLHYISLTHPLAIHSFLRVG